MKSSHQPPGPRPVWASLLVLVAMGLPAGAQTQSIIAFANLNPAHGINAPFYDETGTNRLSGDRYRAALYVGPAGGGAESMRPIGASQPFRTGTAAGYWVSADIPLTLFPPPGEPFDAQVRFWDTVNGLYSTPEQAWNAGAAVGVSLILRLVPPPPPLSGEIPLTGLRPASLMPTAPALSIQPTAGGELEIQWPAIVEGPWTLESTDRLGMNGPWQKETNAPVLLEGRASVRVEPAGTMRAFRLRRDP